MYFLKKWGDIIFVHLFYLAIYQEKKDLVDFLKRLIHTSQLVHNEDFRHRLKGSHNCRCFGSEELKNHSCKIHRERLN